MSRLVEKFGRLITASFFVMAVGIVVFLLTIPLYSNFGIDTDIFGVLIFAAGLALCLTGIIHRKKPRGWKLIILVCLLVIVLFPLTALLVSLVYYLITGRELGG